MLTLADLKRIYREHLEFRILVKLFAPMALVILGLDLYHKPEIRDVLVEANGMLIEVLLIGIIGTAYLHHRYTPVADHTYFSIHRLACGSIKWLTDTDRGTHGYRYGKRVIFSHKVEDSPPGLAGVGLPTDMLITDLAKYRAAIDALMDSSTVDRSPELQFLLIELNESLGSLIHYLPKYKNARGFDMEKYRQNVVVAAHRLLLLVSKRSGECMTREEAINRLKRKSGTARSTATA